jgi:hypothetical protein
MLAVPEVVPVKLAVQLAVPTGLVPWARVHGLPVNEPVTPLWANVTVPVGVIGVPIAVSVTVAVQVEA